MHVASPNASDLASIIVSVRGCVHGCVRIRGYVDAAVNSSRMMRHTVSVNVYCKPTLRCSLAVTLAARTCQKNKNRKCLSLTIALV